MGTPDIVYVVRPGERNEQLRYSLRSVAAHLPHGRVWIAGYRPSWVNGVGHIPTAQGGTKYENSTGNLRAAVEHADVNEDFLLCNDDFFVMSPVGVMPVLHRGPVKRVEAYYASRARGKYLRGLRETRALIMSLGLPEPMSYELHVPMPMSKTRALETLDAGKGLDVLHKRTLYGALFNLGGRQIPDPKVLQRSGHFSRTSPFLSTMTDSFERGHVGAYIRGQFPQPGPYERTRVR